MRVARKVDANKKKRNISKQISYKCLKRNKGNCMRSCDGDDDDVDGDGRKPTLNNKTQ